MPKRSKVLIIENDDFLREIIGNLLHKNDFYIIDAYSLEIAIQRSEHQKIDKIIIGSSIEEFNGKNTIHFLRKKFDNPRIMLINEAKKKVSYLPQQDQILSSKLSIQTIINRISE